MFKQIKYIFCACVILFSGCSSYAKDIIPYLIDASVNMDASSDYEIAGLDFSFFNRSEKTVSEFTLVFYLFDEDGEPASLCRSNIVLSVSCEIPPGERLEKLLSLDTFFSAVPEQEYFTDYVYVSKIKYEDGSTWKDPFGLSLY